MTDTASPAAPPPAAQPAPAPTWKDRIGRWASVIVGICAAIVGVVKLIDAFSLPACDSSRSLDAIHSIFKDKNLPDPTLTGPKAAGEPATEKTCVVSYALPNEKGTLDYKVFWDGWSAKVMIVKVNS